MNDNIQTSDITSFLSKTYTIQGSIVPLLEHLKYELRVDSLNIIANIAMSLSLQKESVPKRENYSSNDILNEFTSKNSMSIKGNILFSVHQDPKEEISSQNYQNLLFWIGIIKTHYLMFSNDNELLDQDISQLVVSHCERGLIELQTIFLEAKKQATEENVEFYGKFIELLANRTH